MKASFNLSNPVVKLGAIALTVSILSSCGPKSAPTDLSGLMAGNIVGGKSMTASDQSKMGVVGIVIITDQGTGICSGSLLSKRIVITAAHCLDESEGQIQKMFVVFSNDISKAQKANVIPAVTGLQNENFAPSADGGPSWNDVALVKLSADAPAGFATVRLPTAATDAALKAGSKLTEAGFGKAEASRTATADTSGVLRQVGNLALLKKSPDGKELNIDESTKGSCNGDSGGPAFVKDTDGKNTLVGLDSRGNSQTTCLDVGIYTNVASHLAWIASTSAKLMAMPDPSPAAASAPVVPAPAPNSPAPAPVAKN
ncbi:MAG: S1 family peptidase [Pseudobdellovibrio sp.]